MSKPNQAAGDGVVPREVPTSRGEAVSDRGYCGALTRAGTPCRKRAGWGTPNAYGNCKLHGGLSPNGLRHAAKLEAEAAGWRVMGHPTHIDAGDALQFAVDKTMGEIQYCDQRIATLTDADATANVGSTREHQELDRDGSVHDLTESTVSTTAELHIWIQTRQAAVDRLVRYSKTLLDADIAERQVAMAEGTAALLEPVLAAIFHRLGLTPEQRAIAPTIVVEELRQLEPPPIGGTW